MAQDDDKTAPSRVNIVYNSNEAGRSDVELPFKVLVMGDFTGVEDETLLNERESIPVTADNLNAVMRALSPRVEITVPDTLRGNPDERIPVKLRFESLEDFTPKTLAGKIAPLQEALGLRQSLVEARKALAEKPGLAQDIKDFLARDGMREKLTAALKETRPSKTVKP
jgi:type VI secretion system protein ImpB